MLFGGGIGCVRRQLHHFFAATKNFNRRRMQIGDDISAVLALIKIHFFLLMIVYDIVIIDRHSNFSIKRKKYAEFIFLGNLLLITVS